MVLGEFGAITMGGGNILLGLCGYEVRGRRRQKQAVPVSSARVRSGSLGSSKRWLSGAGCHRRAYNKARPLLMPSEHGCVCGVSLSGT